MNTEGLSVGALPNEQVSCETVLQGPVVMRPRVPAGMRRHMCAVSEEDVLARMERESGGCNFLFRSGAPCGYVVGLTHQPARGNRRAAIRRAFGLGRRLAQLNAAIADRLIIGWECVEGDYIVDLCMTHSRGSIAFAHAEAFAQRRIAIVRAGGVQVVNVVEAMDAVTSVDVVSRYVP